MAAASKGSATSLVHRTTASGSGSPLATPSRNGSRRTGSACAVRMLSAWAPPATAAPTSRPRRPIAAPGGRPGADGDGVGDAWESEGDGGGGGDDGTGDLLQLLRIGDTTAGNSIRRGWSAP